MSVRSRLSIALLLVALSAILLAPPALAGAASSPAPIGHKSKKKCPKGYKPKTVVKHGKKVKVCRKAKAPAPTPTPTPSPTPTPQQGLFEAPGRKLEGKDAIPFLQKYLANSTFTDCPSGWPNCAVEQRYSHAADNTFHYCRLTSSSGSDIRVTDEYGVEGAIVEPDGSWTFREKVYDSGHYPTYEWHVSASGIVNGAYAFPGNPIEQIGPLQYLSGAKDCGY